MFVYTVGSLLIIILLVWVVFKLASIEAYMYVQHRKEGHANANHPTASPTDGGQEEQSDAVVGDSLFPDELRYTEGGIEKVARRGTRQYDEIINSW